MHKPALKTIALLGGMSWESTTLYYQHINCYVRDAALASGGDGLSSAPMLMDSVNFAPIAKWQREGEWDKAADYFTGRAQAFEVMGAACIGIATNTMHKIYEPIAAAVQIPVLHIATPVCQALQQHKLKRVVFLGTNFTMSGAFMRQAYAQHGIEWVLPTADECKVVHEIIYEQLCHGIITPAAKTVFIDIIERLVAQCGAQAVILGCTEITLLIQAQDISIPTFDSTALHSQALAQFCLSATESFLCSVS